MRDWSVERLDRFKNIMAFLLSTFSEHSSFMRCIDQYDPITIEANFIKYLGPNLPSNQEYNFGLYQEEIDCFSNYLNKWSSKE